MNKTAQAVWQLAEPIAAKHGLEIWDVEYVKEGGQQYLRVYIDKIGGITIDDCEKLSRELDAVLDETDPISDSYIFEVSSPGAERKLRRPSDFQRFMGYPVEVKLYKPYEGSKIHSGILRGFQNGSVIIDDDNGSGSQTFDDYAQVRLRIQL